MELKKCLQFRNLWIGIAMLWIVFFHSSLEIDSQGLVLFKNFGYGGVDICLFAPGCCVLVSAAAEKLDGHKIFRGIRKLLEFVGIYSFELYLIHVFFYEGVMPQILDYLWKITVNMQWLMSIPVIILGTFLLNRVTSFVSRLLSTKKA